MKFVSKSRLSFIISLVIAIFILIGYKTDRLSYGYIDAKIADFIAPIERISSSSLYTITNFIDRIGSFFSTFKENNKLKKINSTLEKYHYLYEQLEEENKQLREELNFAKNLEHKYITAQVIARDNSGGHQQITVNIGREQGVMSEQIAVLHDQLIGRVTRVTNNTATILLLSDKDSRVPVISLQSKVKCIAAGLSTDYLSCKYLNEQAELNIGEIIVTSGDNQAISPGIIVGSISKQGDNFYIKPMVDFNKIEFIRIIQP
jgi:rod shape-determining protein MreC